MSRCTIHRDIEDISKIGIPIVTTQGKNDGISIMKEFEIERTLLTSSEIQSRCGTLCSMCRYQNEDECKGCLKIEKPFWGDACEVKTCCEKREYEHCGQCTKFACLLLKQFAYDKRREMMESGLSNVNCGRASPFDSSIFLLL